MTTLSPIRNGRNTNILLAPLECKYNPDLSLLSLLLIIYFVIDDAILSKLQRRLGYHFSSKLWVELAVDKIKDIKVSKDPSAFKSLELLKSQKSLIESLVRCHGVKDEDRSMKDLMKGKGNGLVILLHGTSLFSEMISVHSCITGPPVLISPSIFSAYPKVSCLTHTCHGRV